MPRRGPAPGRHLLGALGFLAGACLCFGLAWIYGYPWWVFDRYGVATTARIMAVSEAPGASSSSHPGPDQLLELGYILPDGSLQRAQLRQRASAPGAQPGQVVRIIYLSHRLNAVRLAPVQQEHMPSNTWWFLGGGLALLGFAIQRVARFLRARRDG